MKNPQSASFQCFKALRACLFWMILTVFFSCADQHIPQKSPKTRPGDFSSEENFRKSVIDKARTYLEVPYKTGGRDTKGFDCSGFVCYVLKNFNVEIPPSSREQAMFGKVDEKGEIKPGDLIFFGKSDQISHVGLITQSDKNRLKVIHSTSSKGVIEEDIVKSDYWLRRVHSVKCLMSYLANKPLTSL